MNHRLSGRDENVHNEWNNSLDPQITIEPDDTVQFECPVGFDDQIDIQTTAEEFHRHFKATGHNLVGPVAIAGAEPGDVLEVKLLDVQHGGWGHTFFRPGETGRGLLPEEFPDPELHIWDLGDDTAHFVDGIELPLDPFPGNVGVAPAEAGTHSTVPPRNAGGNMDVRQFTEGATAFLPIEVEGGLFSIGDGHAAQGDGEVCLSAIETPMLLTARFSLHKDQSIERPEFRTPGSAAPSAGDSTYLTTGIDADLHEASKQAVQGMIAHLGEHYELSRQAAYVLCSVAVDLRISEIVNEPNVVVSAEISEGIFPDDMVA